MGHIAIILEIKDGKLVNTLVNDKENPANVAEVSLLLSHLEIMKEKVLQIFKAFHVKGET